MFAYYFFPTDFQLILRKFKRIQSRLETVAKKRALRAPGHLTGTDPDKTRLSEGAKGRKRARPRKGAPCPLAPLCALGEARLIGVSARQMTRGAEGFLATVSSRDCNRVNQKVFRQKFTDIRNEIFKKCKVLCYKNHCSIAIFNRIKMNIGAKVPQILIVIWLKFHSDW